MISIDTGCSNCEHRITPGMAKTLWLTGKFLVDKLTWRVTDNQEQTEPRGPWGANGAGRDARNQDTVIPTAIIALDKQHPLPSLEEDPACSGGGPHGSAYSKTALMDCSVTLKSKDWWSLFLLPPIMRIKPLKFSFTAKYTTFGVEVLLIPKFSKGTKECWSHFSVKCRDCF